VLRHAWIAGVIILFSTVRAAEHLLAWVALGEAERVEVLDLTTGSVLKNIEIGTAPTQLSISPDLNYLYVSCRSDGQTRVVKPLSGAPIKRLPYVHPLFIPGDPTHYYAPGLGGVFRYEVDGYRFDQLAYLPDTQNSYAYSVSADGEWFVYVQHFVDWRGGGITNPPVYERVAVCNLAEATGTYLELDFEPLSVAVAPTGEFALVGGEDGTVLLLGLGDPPRTILSDSFDLPVRFVGFKHDASELYFAFSNLVFTSWTRYWTTAEPVAPDYRVHRAAEDMKIVAGSVAPDGRVVLLDTAGHIFLVDPAAEEGEIEPVLNLESASSGLTVALVDEEDL
jgi:WD40 repeat protein